VRVTTRDPTKVQACLSDGFTHLAVGQTMWNAALSDLWVLLEGEFRLWRVQMPAENIHFSSLQ